MMILAAGFALAALPALYLIAAGPTAADRVAGALLGMLSLGLAYLLFRMRNLNRNKIDAPRP
jgi:multisubunit Na+/H+ antiporter MnhF subunit